MQINRFFLNDETSEGFPLHSSGEFYRGFLHHAWFIVVRLLFSASTSFVLGFVVLRVVGRGGRGGLWLCVWVCW